VTLLRVNVGGIDFFGHQGPFAIGKEGFTGWDDQEYRSASEARVNAHGNYPERSYREAKTVNLNGFIIANGSEQLNHYMDLFNGILAEGRSEKLTVDRPWGARWAPASVVSRKTVEVGGLPRATFALSLRLESTERFGQIETFSGGIGTAFDVFQRGVVETWPMLTVTGSMPGGYEISLGGQLLEITKGIATGQTHTIDTKTGILRSNGSVVVGGLGITELFTVKPGLAQSIYSAPRTTGTGTLKVEVTDTY